ncbi:unnamed protein product [Ceutorhynchus assimilis]|uniref:Biogenesis of lysosome-related organelles complex 1 subunit 4 n=1 Tax=Ceutorhynchus assimilis TaxID=467358 RepID=A0A9N9MUU3_9CUCU|nr:unnamed protein product [Ceutorhynchus assimilis]
MKTIVEKTAKDYSKYIDNINLNEKLEPVNKALDDMLTRLEEFETMLSFIQPDVNDSTDILKSILNYKPEFEELCEKIDATEFLIAHIKSNLDNLEAKIEEAEAKMGVSDATAKVTNIFTPLFKKSPEKHISPSPTLELFKTEEYFRQE